MDNIKLPRYAIFTFGLGPKFNHTYNGTNSTTELETLVCFDKIKETADNYIQYHSIEMEMRKFTHPRSKANTEAQTFINEQMIKTKKFLKRHRDIMITPADKGGKCIILREKTYDHKAKEHINKGIEDGTYRKVTDVDSKHIRKMLEEKYEYIRGDINKYLKKDATTGLGKATILNKEPYIMSTLVITLKVHKQGTPPRPIISARNRWAKKLSQWILTILETIAQKYNYVKIKNSEEFAHKIRDINKTITKAGGKNTTRMVTWDYVSMYTNIPIHRPLSIIANNYNLITKKTHMPFTTFFSALETLIDSSAFFTYKGEIFEQTKGLTMGNDLSQILAEITTNEATITTIKTMDKNHIPFICKYVDDFAAIIEKTSIEMFERKMNQTMPDLPIERSDEDKRGNITYLDIKITRNDDGNLDTEWWQKECSTRQILNFHSNHPTFMKRNMVKEFIRHAITITSPNRHRATIQRLTHTLRRSSYPKNFILKQLKHILEEIGSIITTSHVGNPDPTFDFNKEIDTRKQANTNKYLNSPEHETPKIRNIRNIPFPYSNPQALIIANNIIRRTQINCRLAAKPFRTNERTVFPRKTKPLQLHNTINATFELKCKNCDFKEIGRTNNTDIERTIITDIKTGNIARHTRDNPGHTMDHKPNKIRTYKNAYDTKLTYERMIRMQKNVHT